MFSTAKRSCSNRSARSVWRGRFLVAGVACALCWAGQALAAGASIDVRFLNADAGLRLLPPGLDVPFEIQVENTGAVDLRNVRIADPLIPACDLTVGDLRVGESLSYRCADTSGRSGGPTRREFVDRFHRADFGNQDGIDRWVGAWEEIDPEGEGPLRGAVQVNGGKLRLVSGGFRQRAPSLSRSVDLSGMERAVLHIDGLRYGAARPGSAVLLEIAVDGGDFRVLDRLTGPAGAAAYSRSYDISPWISAHTTIRLRGSEVGGGEPGHLDLRAVEIAAQGWSGGRGYTNTVTAVAEDAAGAQVTDSAETQVAFLVEQDPSDVRTRLAGRD